METPKLILPTQVRPQRVDKAPVQADTESPKSIFDNTEFLAELKKGPKQALKALRDLKPEQLEEFFQSANKNQRIEDQVMSSLIREFQRDLANPSAQKVFIRQLAEYNNNPDAARAKVQEQVAKITQTQAPKAVVERAPVVGRSLEKQESPSRVLAQVLAA